MNGYLSPQEDVAEVAYQKGTKKKRGGLLPCPGRQTYIVEKHSSYERG